MSIQPLRSASAWVPPLPQRITPVATSTDETQTIGVEPNGILRIAGVASADDGAGTEVRLSFDGALVSVALREGMTAAETFRLLEKVMPDGYRLAAVNVARGEGEVRGELVRRPSTRRFDPPVVPDNVRRLPSPVDVFSR